MIQIDGGDERDVGVHHVDRIEPSPEANLEHRHVEIGAGEQIQRRQGAELEIAQAGVTARLLHPRESGAQGDVIHGHTVQTHPFVVAPQMRRGVAADAPPGRRENGLQEGDAGALAVGAGDGDDPSRRARPAHRLVHGAHPAQSQFDFARMKPLEMSQPAGQIARGRRSAHSAGGAGWRMKMRRMLASRSRIWRRSRMTSTVPCSSRNSLR